MSTWRQDIVKREKNKTLIKTVIDKPKSWCSRVGVVKIQNKSKKKELCITWERQKVELGKTKSRIDGLGN